VKRLLDELLTTWQHRRQRKPLVVRGARQVGKTYSVSAFGRQHFAQLLHVDFELDRGIHRIFAGDLQARRLALDLEAYTQIPVVPGRTLLFLDEIQACPRALMALRVLHEQLPALHVIAAGSLLEFALEDSSFPVGRAEFEWLYPLCFEEFLWATGNAALARRLPCVGKIPELSMALHEKLMAALRHYFIVGGMPEAVQRYAAGATLDDVGRVHRALIHGYAQDFAKYGGRLDRECIEQVFQQMPGQVGRQIKYTALYPEKRIETIKRALHVLERTLVVHRVRATHAHGLPLGADVAAKHFKAVFLDIALMQVMCGISAREVLAADDVLAVYRGALAEQFVGQELLARGGSEDNQLYYWARQQRNSDAEIDYLWRRGDTLVPIEVKSGTAGRLKSMALFLAEHPQCHTGVVLSSALAEQPRRAALQFLPLYAKFA
jgi:predicted AAA+ superfamily ATPase